MEEKDFLPQVKGSLESLIGSVDLYVQRERPTATEYDEMHNGLQYLINLVDTRLTTAARAQEVSTLSAQARMAIAEGRFTEANRITQRLMELTGEVDEVVVTPEPVPAPPALNDTSMGSSRPLPPTPVPTSVTPNPFPRPDAPGIPPETVRAWSTAVAIPLFNCSPHVMRRLIKRCDLRVGTDYGRKGSALFFTESGLRKAWATSSYATRDNLEFPENVLKNLKGCLKFQVAGNIVMDAWLPLEPFEHHPTTKMPEGYLPAAKVLGGRFKTWDSYLPLVMDTKVFHTCNYKGYSGKMVIMRPEDADLVVKLFTQRMTKLNNGKREVFPR